MSAIITLGSRLTRHVTVYSLGSFVTVILSLVSLAIITRYLSPGEFGRAAVYIVFAGLLTVAFNLGTLQGCFSHAFGSTGEEDDLPDEEKETSRLDKRRALGSGVALTITISVLGSGAAFALAPLVAELLSRNPGDAILVRLAAVSGGLGSLWRLVSNIPRLERRPATYLLVSNLRPIMVLAATIPLVASGARAQDVIAGLAIGTGAALMLGILPIRRSFRLAFDREDVRIIARRGVQFVPIIVAIWIIQNADLLLLAQFAANDEVGVYRLASRVGAIMSYFVGAVNMAWGPMGRSPVFLAAQERHGLAIGAHMCLYFMLVSMGLLLALAVGADMLVQVAPPAYGGAASLIPLTAAGFLAHGAYIVLYRGTRYPGRRRDRYVLIYLAVVVFLVAALAMIPRLGATGAALSVILGFGVAIIVMLFRSQRGPTPLPLDYGRIGGSMVFAVACLLAALWLGRLDVAFGALVGAAVPVIFVGGVFALRLIPRTHSAPLKEIAAGAFRLGISSNELRRRVRALPASDRSTLELVVRHRLTPRKIARSTGASEQVVLERLTRGLRSVAGRRPPSEADDARLGAYLLDGGSRAQRDADAAAMRRAGVDLEDLSALEDSFKALRRRRGRAWRGVAELDSVDRVLKEAAAGHKR